MSSAIDKSPVAVIAPVTSRPPLAFTLFKKLTVPSLAISNLLAVASVS